MLKRFNQLCSGMVLAALSFLLALGAAETAIRVGGLFAAERAAIDSTAERPRPPESPGEFPGAILHPYLGYTQRPGTTVRTAPPGSDDNAASNTLRGKLFVNQQGYISGIRDYLQVDRDKFAIAVFGGSVADMFSSTAWLMFKADIADKLGIAAEKLEILNFAKGGYRQPQQLIALIEALLQGISIDLILNMDGFNEIAMGGLDCERGYDPLYPSAQHYLALLDLRTHGTSVTALDSTLRIYQSKAREAGVRSALERWPILRRSAATEALAGFSLLYLRRQQAALEQRMQEALSSDPRSDLPILSPERRRTSANQPCAATVAETWQRGSLMMHTLARSANIPYLHVLQPNQYVEPPKPLSTEELAEAWQPTLPAAQQARSGYPELQRRGGMLIEQGVTFADFTKIFADHPETVYQDTCCHLNYHGYQIVLENLGPLLAKVARPAAEPSETTAP